MNSAKRFGRAASAMVTATFALATGCSDRTIVEPTRASSDAIATSAAQSAGLVAAYGFNETNGTAVADGSGAGNNGTFGRGVKRSASGRFGRALRFNGNGMVTIPNAPSLELTQAMTLEAWINPSVVSSAWRNVVYKGNDNYYLMATSENGGRPAGGASFGVPTATTEIYGPAAVPLNAWTHLAVTYDGAALRYYVNGVEVATLAKAATITTSSNPLQIGGNQFYDWQFYTGLIDEVRVYNRALSLAEIQTDMITPVGATADGQAPTVSITSPTTAPTYVTNASSVSIGGTASDNVSVTQVTWSTSGGSTGTATGTATWLANVTLQPGTNVVTVNARDAANNIATATLTVTSTAAGNGLVAAYGFDETSGATVTDGSGYSNSGALGSGVTRSASGRFGAALLFNGSGMVTIPNAPSLELTTTMTLEAWINPSVVSSAWRNVVYKGNDNYYLMATSENGGRPAGGASFGVPTATTEIYGTAAVPLNAWTHLAVTYDGAALRFYMNGVHVSTLAKIAAITTSSNPLQIGGNQFYDWQFYTGLIDEVRVYNRALGLAEIQADMNTPVGGTAPPDVVTLSITSPSTSGSYSTTSRTLSMSGTSTGARVKRVTWTNSRGGSGTAVGTTNWSVDGIALQTGTNDLTVVARDSVDGALANASLSVTVDEPPAPTPTQLFIQTQPSATAQSGVPFAQQPIIQLRDASNNAVPQAGVVVTASIATGGGTLGGTTTATTNASGVATFSGLAITGVIGTRALRFDASGLGTAWSSTITVSAGAATRLAIAAQPSATAQSGAAFATQPAVRLQDLSGNNVSQSGVSIAVAIASGGGTLGGTATATTNTSGIAGFTNLQITGTAGTRTLLFSATGLTSVTSTAIAVSESAPPTGGSYPNRPAAFTRTSEIDFSQTLPSFPDNVDRLIAGTNWNMIYFGNNWSKTTDASAPQSAPGIWQGHWAPGSYGGGIIGQGSGHGIGNVFTYAPAGTTRLYVSMRVNFDFDASRWHPISNKFLNIEGDRSLLLMQLKEGSHWRHAEELGFSGFGSFWVDNVATPGEAHIPGQIDNRAVPNRQWVQIEVLIDLPNRIFKIWQDGALTTNATPTFASTRINMVGIYAFRGGGGETLSTDLFYKYDHFFIAW